jgi:hypothetical protein
VFRGAKLRLADIEPSLIDQVLETGGRLVATLHMTDRHGHPVCATVKPPSITWRATSFPARRPRTRAARWPRATSSVTTP